MEPVFLTIAEILQIHKEQVEFYGGSHGLRDRNMLESAIATPAATFGGQYLHETIPVMAAAYLFHITQNHASIDANKRTGANAAMTFLHMNGWILGCSEDELVATTLAVASGVMGKPELTAFFERHAHAKPGLTDC